MPPVFRQSEFMPVGEPGELVGELVLLAPRGRQGDREAEIECPGDLALEASEMFEVDAPPARQGGL